MDYLQEAKKNKEYMIKTRRWLHQNAELSMKEFKTTEYIVNELNEIGIPYVRPTETGVIGTIKGNLGGGKTLGIRADIDALPIEEKTDIPYQSINKGVMHACGHDYHTASLLGAGKLLWRQRNHFSGTIKLIFQHSEEGAVSGAAEMLASGALDLCDAFMTVHVQSAMKKGMVSAEAGPCMAASSGVYITIRGTGSHAASPWEGVDSVLATSAIIMNLQSLISREMDIREPLVLTIGKIHGASAKNIIPEIVNIEGTLRFYSPSREQELRKKIKRVVEYTAEAYGAKANVNVTKAFPSIFNDQYMSVLAKSNIKKIWGVDSIVQTPISLMNDDFAFYITEKPGIYVLVGTGDHENKTNIPLHNPYFKVDEDQLVSISAFMLQFSLDYFKNQS